MNSLAGKPLASNIPGPNPALAAGVVGLIQKVLQIYAALALRVNSPDTTEVALNQVSAHAPIEQV